jgi:hypothetical protein
MDGEGMGLKSMGFSKHIHSIFTKTVFLRIRTVKDK